MSTSDLLSDGLITVTTRARDPALAIREIADRVGDAALAGGLIFCSHSYDRGALAHEIDHALSGVPLIGCTSAGELTTDGYDSDSLVFIGFPASHFHLSILPFPDLDAFDPEAARQRLRQFAATARQDARRLGEDLSHVALILVDGLSHREELLTMTAQESLGDIELIGGSSGDGLAFRETGVFFGGRFHKDAAALAILSSSKPLHVFSINHYQPGAQRMVITEADAESRTVHEINACPAADEYRRLAGHPGVTLDSGFFAAHPLIVRSGGSYHVRSIQSANADGSLTFYCAVDRGIVFTIGEPVDRVAAMRRLFASIRDKIGTVDHIIGFDCVLNRIDSEERQLGRAISELYAEHRVIGFNTYGEQFLAAHVNQTLSGLAIGR